MTHEKKKENIFLRLIHRPRRHKSKQSTTTLPSKPFEGFKKEQRSIHIPRLQGFKRYIAFFLFLINGGFFLFTFMSPPSPPQLILCLFFLGNIFIALDSLWNSSKWRIIKKEEI